MPNTAMKSRTTLKTRPAAVLHTDARKMSVMPLDGVRNFLTSFENAFGHGSNFEMKTIAEATECFETSSVVFRKPNKK